MLTLSNNIYLGNAAPTAGSSGGGVSTDDIIVKSSTIPAASADYKGAVYQYVGTTDANYTHGYIYECVETSSDLGSANYNWNRINVQPSVISANGIPEVTTPDGTDINAIVNVDYVSSVVGTIETALEEV